MPKAAATDLISDEAAVDTEAEAVLDLEDVAMEGSCAEAVKEHVLVGETADSKVVDPVVNIDAGS